MTRVVHSTVDINGTRVHFAEAGEGPLVLFVHGWPETWYSWRYQISALAAAGYHVVAPDVRGYGDSDRPEAIEAYRMKALLADAAGLLDVLGEKTAVVVGHDWGATIAWTFAALYPERVRAVAGLSVPYLGRSPMPPTQVFKSMFNDKWLYLLYFQDPGVAEAEFEADIPRTMRTILGDPAAVDPMSPANRAKRTGDGFLTGIAAPQVLPYWLTEADVAHYAKQFARSRFHGGLHRYRNMDRDWHELPELATVRIEQPALFLVGEVDPLRNFTPVEQMQLLVPNLQGMHIVPGAGHWLQQERPVEVNTALLGFLRSLP